jgi:microcystin-dependent protein
MDAPMPSDPYLGQIMPTAFNFAPRGWALCNGALLPIAQNQALYALLRTTYGGDGRTTFALPNLCGRAVLGSDFNGSYRLGQAAGAETVTLQVAQLPSHVHGIEATTTQGGTRVVNPGNRLFGANTFPAMSIFAAQSANVPLALGTNIALEGGSQPHNNMQPYLVINYVIAVSGVYPMRPD